MPDETNQAPGQDPLQLSEDFFSAYANQVRFETSAWDLKILFGQVDQTGGTAVVEWHTAITIPWAQAKIGVYTLQAHVAGFEAFYGKIQVPWDVVPAPPIAPTEEEARGKPQVKALYETALKLYEQFKSTL
jgi:hypothetical protein